MNKFVLCLALFSVLAAFADAQLAGGFNDISNNALKALEPKLTVTFDRLRADKKDFDLTFKRVVRGKSQLVAGTRYQVTVEATDTSKGLQTCEADILENLSREFDQVDLQCGNHNYRWAKQ